MKERNVISRRTAIKSSIFGLLGVSIPNIIYAKTAGRASEKTETDALFYRYPAIDDTTVSEVVGASHFSLERVTELVTKRPELARATWDWGFGDWETAIGAASHMGRRDIAEFLLSKGARPDIFTFAMLGAFDAVKAMIESSPGIQSIAGPHGISLLQHAKNGLRADNLPQKTQDDIKRLIDYLEALGDADSKPMNFNLSEAEQSIYMGEYRYGEKADEIFVVDRNMRKMLQIARKDTFGGAIYKIGEHLFVHGAAPSVQIEFSVEGDQAVALTIYEPDLTLNAAKI